MDQLLTFLTGIEPQHWLVLGLVLLIAEMASGTTYLLWPAVAAFITGLVAFVGATNWIAETVLFAALVVVLTAFGRPLVMRLRAHTSTLNERGAQMVGVKAVVAYFANGVGAVHINDTMWRAVSEDALHKGEQVEVAAIDGVTLKVKRAAP